MSFRILAVLSLCLVLASVLPASAGAGDDNKFPLLEQRFKTLVREDAAAAFKLALELESAGAQALAAKAYDEAARELFGGFASTNF